MAENIKPKMGLNILKRGLDKKAEIGGPGRKRKKGTEGQVRQKGTDWRGRQILLMSGPATPGGAVITTGKGAVQWTSPIMP